MNRTLNVVRMQLVNRQTFVWVPLIVLGGVFLLTLAIWFILHASGVEGEKYGGGAQAPLWYFGVVGAQAMTLTFPFSQAMSVTRREFFLGTTLTAALTSAIMAVAFVVGGLIETATGGWGVGGYFFALQWLWEGGPLVAGLFFFCITMFAFATGFWGATVYKRFGPLWLTVTLVGLAVLLVAALGLVGLTDSWVGLFTVIADAGVWGLTAAIALLAVAASTAGALILRRTTP